MMISYISGLGTGFFKRVRVWDYLNSTETRPDVIPSSNKFIKIFCHLPVKSLIQFRSVSKEWMSLIDSSEFNSDYIIVQAQRKRLLLRVYTGYVADDLERGRYCWIIDDDDDTFPQYMISLRYSQSAKLVSKFVGSSHSLLYFNNEYLGEYDYFNRYVIWNPSIRKSVTIDVPYKGGGSVGFGVCPNSLDPKIVRINVQYDNDHKRNVWRVGVFTLSGRVWRSPLTKLPSKWVNFGFYAQTPLVIKGFIYCRVLTGVVQRERNGSNEKFHNVWLMDHVSKSFIKLFNVTLPERLWKVLGFRNNDQLIIVKNEYRMELVAYEPDSKQYNNLGLYADFMSSSGGSNDYERLIV
ncbi:putative F-box protein At1g50870 [Rutidosis leptorrhynchoides]|uniref:putative F-box protein At1g50870 n=1 Tax=Rutidosis leptorrhynchoides TaxID=125765 RepID=UPI003A99AD21